MTESVAHHPSRRIREWDAIGLAEISGFRVAATPLVPLLTHNSFGAGPPGSQMAIQARITARWRSIPARMQYTAA